MKTILIAEDDPFIGRMYETKLTDAGYQVILVPDGREAFELIQSQNPDMLILDINLPELTGLEILKSLQAINYDFTAHPILVLTNSVEGKIRDVVQSYGAEFLVKADLAPHDVLAKIQQKLEAS